MSKSRKSKKQQPAVAPLPPPESPLVRRGDVLFTLGHEIQEAARITQQWRDLGRRLAEYQAAHPERHAHLVAFLSGGDQSA